MTIVEDAKMLSQYLSTVAQQFIVQLAATNEQYEIAVGS